MKAIHLLSAICLLLLSFGCAEKNVPLQTEFTGPQVALGNGQAWSYVRTDKSQRPTAIGVQFTAAALDKVPTSPDQNKEKVLYLPKNMPVAPYDHITINWNEHHGYTNQKAAELLHFDLHFYFLSEGERDQIPSLWNDTLMFFQSLPLAYLAPKYQETASGWPRMGSRIIDLLAPEVAGTGPFTHTFLYGKYDGSLNFLETMFTKATLDKKGKVNEKIRQPGAWELPGFYPARYTVDYNSVTKVYTVLLAGLQEF